MSVTPRVSRSSSIAGSTKKRDRHLHPLVRPEHLHLEAEAGDLVEVAAHREGHHVEAGLPGRRPVGGIVGLEEGEPGLAEPQRHRALLGAELPGHPRRRVGVEGDRDQPPELLRGGRRLGHAGGAGEAGHPAEPGIERHRREARRDHHRHHREEREADAAVRSPGAPSAQSAACGQRARGVVEPAHVRALGELHDRHREGEDHEGRQHQPEPEVAAPPASVDLVAVRPHRQPPQKKTGQPAGARSSARSAASARSRAKWSVR